MYVNPILQWFRWVLIFAAPWLAVLLFGGGCGFPQYAVTPTPADNAVSLEKSGGDIRGSVRIGADTNAKFTNVSFKGSNGTAFNADGIEYSSNKTNILTASAGPMSEYDKQLGSYYTGLTNITTANWTGFTSAISAAAPVAGSYLDGLMKVNLAKAQQPTLVQQLGGLVTGGQTSISALQHMGTDPDILAAVNRQVDLRVAELKASTQPATP